MSNELGTHHGKPVMGASVKITKAGDGLTKPLAAEPRTFEPGSLLPVLVWCKVDGENYTAIEVDGGGVIGYGLTFNFKAQEAVVLDHIAEEDLDAMFAEQREKVRAWEREQMRIKNEAKGIIEFELTDGEGPDGERPNGMSDADWEASAREQAPATLASKRARKAADG